MRRALLLALVLALAAPGAAEAQQQLRVTAEPGLTVADLLDVQAELGGSPGPYAVGLLVPDAGPETSEERARASLERGRVRNSLHGELPEGAVLIELTAPEEFEPPGIAVGVPQGGLQANDRRYAIALFATGYDGLLTSPSTRIPGLVSIVDVAPTALGERGGLGSRPHDRPLAALLDLDRRIQENGRARLPASALAVVLLVLLAFVHPAGAVLGFATGAATNLVLGLLGVSAAFVTIPALALGTLAGAAVADLLRGPVARGLALGGVLLAYLVALAASPASVALSPLGPTQNARFYGISNLLATMLLVPALAAGALLWRRWGIAGPIAVAALALVTVGGSRFGADGGGAIVLAAGFAVLAVSLGGGGRRAWLAGGAAAVAAVALVALDALLGPTTHVGRSVRGGPGEVLGDAASRVVLSAERVVSHWSVALVVVASLALLAALVARGHRRGSLTALPLAFAAAIVVSLLVNDSPGDVAVGGVVGYLALARFSLFEGEARR